MSMDASQATPVSMGPPAQPARKRSKLLLGCGALVGLLVCGAIVGAFTLSRGGGQANPTAVAAGNAPAGASVAGGGASTAAAPGIGQTVSVKNWDLSVAAVDKQKELTWTSVGNKEAAAGVWLIVEMDMKNTGNTNFGVNTFDFEVKDGKGVTYKHSDSLAALSYSDFEGGQRVSGQVPPGVKVHYYLVFDINPDATGLQLVFKQDKRPAINLGQ